MPVVPPNLSEDMLASYRDVFSLFDKDSSGTISANELATVMKAFGQNATDDQIKYIMRKIDIDQNGAIDFEEFVSLMSRPELSPIAGQGQVPGAMTGVEPPSVQELLEEEDAELLEAFRVFDEDGSGKISFNELAHVMDLLGEKLSPDELNMMINEADLDGDHEISFKEFKKMMTGR